ncbi:hypothetical protein DL89DRAFT_257644 [Linderina pennispora]|uniref:DUF3020 domain-containing protein n=1 Tax=Linderina pennispora TaxID=61395 RepID=A0A1Y1W888_9FUNG|nr:uncharacterized protein DL89DRAFT_257644 [Linderina pennispora]ORX69384.1 hypothetical protein DL89DRAFT_257644 [Linderina pennispora]
MLASARSLSKQVLSHRAQIQQQTKSQLKQHNQQPRSARDTRDAPEDLQVLEKMRQENRERKKRWRELNEERNKDNDLRCRVNKRATQLYGAQSTPAKEKWIVEEFERRQQRRKDKERRKQQQKIPTNFSQYSALPPHQVSAAHEFWRGAAERHAVEQSKELVFRHYVEPAVTGGLTLPPLSSVIPKALMHAPEDAKTRELPEMHAGELSSTPTLAVPSRSQSFSARHVRPWEEESLPDDDLLALANPDISRTPTLMSPMPADKDLGGLAEAAFSLMSLSSSSAGSPMP